MPEALAAFRRSVELKERIGAPASALISWNNLASQLVAIGKLDEAEEILTRLARHEDAHAVLVVATAVGNLGDIAIMRGDLDRAIELHRQATARNEERGVLLQTVHTVIGLARALAMRQAPGDLAEAERRIDALAAIAWGVVPARFDRRLHCTRAMLHDAAGRAEEALRMAELAAGDDDEVMEMFGALATPLEAHWIHALMHARVGRRADAERIARGAHARLLRLARAAGDPAPEGAFLSCHPLRRAILAGTLDCPPGWTWPRPPPIAP